MTNANTNTNKSGTPTESPKARRPRKAAAVEVRTQPAATPTKSADGQQRWAYLIVTDGEVVFDSKPHFRTEEAARAAGEAKLAS